MALSDAEWDDLHRRLWAAVVAHGVRIGETAGQYTALIVEAIQAAGGVLSEEARQHVTDYIDAADGMLRDGIRAAVGGVAEAAVAVGMRDEWIAARVTEAYERRWPDGLRLSDRVWRWSEETRRGVSDALAAGVRLERTAGTVMMDMQRAIEAAAGERFAIETQQAADWMSDLASEGRRAAGDPRMMSSWLKALERAQGHVDGLADGGTRRQARAALEGVREAVLAGRRDLIDARLRWWLYDRQQYRLRRVVRTEMSTAYHRAVLAVGDADPDVVGYRWRLSPSHPAPDICDYYADIDLGMGAGVWPRDQAPKGKAHPHCMCSITPTTRRMRRDGVRGATDLPAFLGAAPTATLREMVPAWARAANARGVPWARMVRADGRWLISEAEALAAGIVPSDDRGAESA